jgi:3-phosphoshikimate 1-carboxyvinyltransferase
MPSAQVKSAILLAGLFADGETIVTETRATRDHTEIMMRHFGVAITAKDGRITLKGGTPIAGCSVEIPGDPSAAAFIAAAAVLRADSDVTMNRICINPTRIGFYDVLRAMGADITIAHERIENGERVADITIRGGAQISGIIVTPERIPAMVDEIPILAAIAACAQGPTILQGLAELRIKESDRVALMAAGLKACGVEVEIDGDDMTIHGQGQPPRGGALVETALDHRIAMSFLVLGTVTDEPVTVDDARPIGTSFPDFAKVMNDLGAQIAKPDSPVFADAES